MLQFYFLSVLLNLMTGLFLLYGESPSGEEPSGGGLSGGENEDSEDGLSGDGDGASPAEKKLPAGSGVFGSIFKRDSFFYDSLFQLVLGCLAVFTGLVKLFCAVQSVPVFGDLLPAAAGLTGGAAVLLGYFSEKSSVDLSLPDLVRRIFIDGKSLIAVVCIAAAALHFIVPSVLFL